jgi:hypothetical protein
MDPYDTYGHEMYPYDDEEDEDEDEELPPRVKYTTILQEEEFDEDFFPILK